MPPALINVLVGLMQTAVPSLVTYGLSQHWFDAGSLGGIAAIAGAIAAAGHSAVTTTAVSK